MSQSLPTIVWQEAFGGTAEDDISSIVQTSDNGSILCGYSKSNISGDKSQNSKGLQDYWIVKIDSLGIKQWDKTFGGSNGDFLYNINCVDETTDNGFILGGWSNSIISGDKTQDTIGATDFWILKIDSIGDIQWQKTIGGDNFDYLSAIHQTPDGGFIIGGDSYSGISGNKIEANIGGRDYWIIKIDSIGDIVWQNTIGGNDNDELYTINLTTDGGYIIGGASYSGMSGDKIEPNQGPGFRDYWVIRIDSIGNIIDQNTIGGDDEDYKADIIQTTDGGFLVGGTSFSNAGAGDKIENSFNGDYWILKLDNNLNIVWQNTIGGTSGEILSCIKQYIDGSFILGGSSASNISNDKSEISRGFTDYWIVKIDTLGNKIWDKTIGGNSNDQLSDIQIAYDYGIIAGGRSPSGTSGDKTVFGDGSRDYWIVKLSSPAMPSVVNNALNFDGLNDFISIPHNPQLSLTSFTVEAWVKTTLAQPNGRVVTKPVGSDQNYSLYIEDGYAGITFDNGTSGIYVTGSTYVSDGNWHHLAGIYDQIGGELKIYVDGNLDSVISTTSIPVTSTEALQIGRFNASFGQYHQFTLDEVRIWNFARSQAEVQTGMSCEITTPQPGLVANYNFNHGIAGQDNSNPPVNILEDLSGNNFDGTLDTSFSLTGTTSNWVLSDSIKISPLIFPSGTVNIIAGDSIELKTYSSSCFSFQWYKNNVSIPNANLANYFATDSGTYNVIAFYGTHSDTSNSVLVNITSVTPVNNSLHFDGNNDGVIIGDTSLFNTPNITVQAWVKPFANSQSRGVVTKRGCCNDPLTLQWTLQTNPNNMGFVAQTTGGFISLIDSNPLNLNTWTQYTATYDGNFAKLYTNGILVYQDTIIGAIVSLPSIPVYIGRRDIFTQGPPDYWEGEIEEVRIWSKALTQEEIQDNINCELIGNEDSLIAYYNFNQGVAGTNNSGTTTLIDLSPNNLNGTLVNFNLSGNTSNWVSSDSIKINPEILQEDTVVICSGDSTMLNTFASDCYNFQWYKNGVALNGQTLSSVSVFDSGFYSVRISYGNLSVHSTDSVKILLINSNSVFISPSGNINICSGDSITLTSNQVSGNFWSNGNSSQSITVNQSGSFYVVNGCDTSSSVNVTVNPLPQTPVINASSDSLCFSETVTLSTDTTATAWLWSNGDTTSSIVINTAGIYFVTLINSFGCTSAISNTDTIFSKPGQNYYKDQDSDAYGNPDSNIYSCSQPLGYVTNNTDCDDLISSINSTSAEVCDGLDNNCDGIIDNIGGTFPIITGNRTVCSGNNISLNISGNGPFEWYKDAVLVPGNSTLLISNADSSDAGQYFVTFNSGCTIDTLFETVFVVTPPEATIVGLLNAYCLNGTSSLLTGIPSGGAFSVNVSSSNYYSPVTLGVDTIIYTSPSYYGCPADTTIAITTVNSSPALSLVSSSGSSVICTDSSLILTANPPANIYQWNTGSSLQSINISTPGVYTVTVTNAVGCSTQSSIGITLDPVPYITTGGGNAMCSGDSIQLTYNANTVQWSTSSQNNTIYFSYDSLISNYKDTFIYVIGTSNNGCTYQDSISIRINPGETPMPVSNMYPPDSSFNLFYPITFSWFPGLYNTKYDLLLYDSNDNLQSAFNSIYNISYTLTSGLNYGQTYKWKVVSHNGNCADTLSATQTFSVRELPDLTIQNVNVPSTLVAGSTINVSWQIVNVGNGSTGSKRWIDQVYLSANDSLEIGYDQLLASHLNFSALDSFGVAYLDSVSFITPINYIGNYHVIIRTDPTNQLLEANKNNNIFISDSINFITPPLPDLRISSVAAQTNIFSGDTIAVNYTITNHGNYFATSNSRLDRVYITSNSLLDTVGIPIAATLGLNDTLQPGQSKTYSSNYVIVPKYISGTYFVHILTDATNQIFESGEGNNSGADSINVFLTPPPDLVVNGFEISDTLNSGEYFQVSYTLKNEGFNRTDSIWFDGIFLSSDTIFDFSNAIPLKWVLHTNENPDSIGGNGFNVIILVPCPPNVDCHYEYVTQFYSGSNYYTLNDDNAVIHRGGLDAGDSIKYFFGGNLSDTLTGDYNVFVVTDVINSIFEYNKEGNNIIRRGDFVSGNPGINQPVYITNPDLIVNSISAPNSASAGLNINVNWEIKNIGAGNLVNKLRKDAIYLSDSSDFDAGNKLLLGYLEYDTPLSKNAVTQKQKSITVPVGINGIKYLFIQTDYLNTVFESNQNNNVSVPEQIQIDVTNWADLIPDTISFPDSIVTTLNFNFANTVLNAGTLYTNGSWTDHLYISPSPVFDGSATLIKTFSTNGNVSVGSSYGFNQSIALPLTSDLIAGQDSSWYYFHYKANANNQLFENGFDFNNNFLSDSVFVYNKYVDHIVTSIVTDDTAASFQFFNVQWTVKNIGFKTGNGYYNQWSDAIYFSMDTIFDASDTLIGNRTIFTTLNNNQVYTQNKDFRIPDDVVGNRYIFVKTDYFANIIGEFNKENNLQLKRDAFGNPLPVFFDAPPKSDLIPYAFTAPASSIAGQPIIIRFNVKNGGLGKAMPTSWTDQVFLSNGYYPSGNIIYNNNHTAGLDTNANYMDSLQVFIPNNASGNYVLVLQTDALNRVYEISNANNFAYSVISITQLPQTDLIASGITAPAIAQSGSSATISWNLQNASLNPAYGYTRQAVYLSQDTLWDSNDALFGFKDTTVNIPAGSLIPFSITANLNASLEGTNFAIVRVDLLNNINESNEINNESSSDSISISIKELPIAVKTGDVLYNDNLQYYKLKTDTLAGETILLSVTGDTINGNTELFVSFGQTPTTSVYDFADFNPYNKRKQIIIPQADSGSYYIAVKGNTSNGISQGDTLLAQILPFSILKVETNHGGNTGNVTVKVSGSKFEQGMFPRLVPVAGGTPITSDTIPANYFINSTAVWVTFQLNQKPLGLYNLQFTKSDNSTATLDSSFIIEAGNSGTFNVIGMSNTGMTGQPNNPGCDPGAGAGINQNLQVTINHPYQERTGRNVPVTILYFNQSNVDIPMPTRLLVSELFPVAWAPNFPSYQNKELIIEFSEPGSPPGILRAGASGGITFYTRVIGPILNHYYIK